jgi:hypothetical protein
MLSTCDHAGIFKVNTKTFCKTNEVNLTSNLALNYFNNQKQRVRVISENLWLIEDFFQYQYGEVFNPNNRVHDSIEKIYQRHQISLTSIRGLREYNDTLKDKDKDKDKDIVKEKENKEEEPKKEEKSDSKKPTKEQFLTYVEERCATVGVKYSEYKQNASVKYDAWAANGWKDLNGNKISAWKGKVVSNLQYWKSESGKPSQSGTVDLNKDFNYSNLQ